MSNRVMLITGGFGGLGTALGQAAERSGYKVALVGRSEAPRDDFYQPALITTHVPICGVQLS